MERVKSLSGLVATGRDRSSVIAADDTARCGTSSPLSPAVTAAWHAAPPPHSGLAPPALVLFMFSGLWSGNGDPLSSPNHQAPRAGRLAPPGDLRPMWAAVGHRHRRHWQPESRAVGGVAEAPLFGATDMDASAKARRARRSYCKVSIRRERPAPCERSGCCRSVGEIHDVRKLNGG